MNRIERKLSQKAKKLPYEINKINRGRIGKKEKILRIASFIILSIFGITTAIVAFNIIHTPKQSNQNDFKPFQRLLGK